MSDQNPIVSRLERLRDQWTEFALRPDARVLRWLVRADELRVIETFVATESDDRAGELPDLFVTLAEPFADVDGYGTALRAGLVAQYEASRADMAAEGLDASWTPPPPSPDLHSLGHLIETCVALRAHYPEMQRLALVLLPAAVSDHAEWQRWLVGAARHLPADVRLVVADAVEAPTLAALAAGEPARVHSVAADLDVPGLLLGFARMGGTARPDGQFRVHFTAMATAIGAGDLAAAERAAEQALAVAEREGWPHLASTVHFAMAAGLMSAGRPAEASAAYQQADAAATRVAESDEALGTRLRLNAAFGIGAVLVGQQEFARAAAVYEASAPMAHRVGDPFLLVECCRMAAHCHEQSGDLVHAWQRGFAALDAASLVPPEQRAHSMIPFVREGLLRLAGGSRPHVDAVELRVAQLMGGGAPVAGPTGLTGAFTGPTAGAAS